MPPAERAHLDVGRAGEGADRLVHHFRREQRFVALDVDDQVAVEAGGDLGQRDRVPDAMVGSRQHGLAAEPAHGLDDARVVGGDDDARDRAGARRLPIDVLDHRPAGDFGQRLAR